MTTTSILKIEPYNEYFFINCKYNLKIPIIKFLKHNEVDLFIDHIPIYDRSSEGSISIKYQSLIPQWEQLSKFGIKETRVRRVDSIISEIKECINYNLPAIIKVDCYYIPNHKAFGVNHYPLDILVYGYDSTTEVFQIIMQNHATSLTYIKKEVSFNQISISYESYLRYFLNSDEGYSFLRFERKIDQAQSYSNHKMLCSNYYTNISVTVDSQYDGLMHLQTYIEDYEVIYLNEIILIDSLDEIIEGLNSIINAKRVQGKIIENLYSGANDLSTIIKEIIYKWSIFRNKIVKLKYSGRYLKLDYIKLKGYIIEIYNYECCLLEKLNSSKLIMRKEIGENDGK